MSMTSESNLPAKVVFKILTHVLAYSVHQVVMSPDPDIDWFLNVHHTLSSVCVSFREIMHQISTEAFQYTPSTDATDVATHSLPEHVHRRLRNLRRLGKVVREPSVGSFTLESLDPTAPQLVQGYSLYIAIVYLRTQASRSTREIYKSTSVTIFGAVITLSKVLYSRIAPREVSVMLQAATEDEAELSNIGVLLVKKLTGLSDLLDSVERSEYSSGVLESESKPDPSKLKTDLEQLITTICALDIEFLSLLQRSSDNQGQPPPCCNPLWLAQLPDVQTTLSKLVDVSGQHPELVERDFRERLDKLFERWTSPPAETTSEEDSES
ncbi:hypothetical protein FB45DRAFT_1069524 [Roridomyces roridus]|uniref:Uncharacterized protein n=1 Tax=Roridomyces roridus TaxID=1738132 RepID=A0AAD7AZ45_9AGAR|nr:hypothetical protein FB45DRAFT_1069524 [Roridomyces roridus]